jgi:hypothetical protein
MSDQNRPLGVYRLSHDNEGEWVYLTGRGNTCMVRRYSSEGADEARYSLDSESLTLLLQDSVYFSAATISTMLGRPHRRISVYNHQAWTELMEALSKKVETATPRATSLEGKTSVEGSLDRLIPITALRNFYKVLRLFPSTAFHLQAARECERRPEQVQALFAESVTHFARYVNGSDRFHDRVADGTVSLESSSDGQMCSTARRLVSFLASGHISMSPEWRHLECDYVDHELSPFRTKQACFENGVSGRRSGRGGVDVVLANRLDKMLIVGEVKAETDTNPFLGLIQALTYTVEMTTAAQRARLARCYQQRFESLVGGPYADIYLILIRYPTDEEHQEFLRITGEIAKRILEENGAVAAQVRRIVCLATDMNQGDRLDFSVMFIHESRTERREADE